MLGNLAGNRVCRGIPLDTHEGDPIWAGNSTKAHSPEPSEVPQHRVQPGDDAAIRPGESEKSVAPTRPLAGMLRTTRGQVS